MRRIKWLLCLLLVLAASPALADDTDTLTVDGKKYRLDGIDAPESDQGCASSGFSGQLSV